ncbi:hypothetical protein SDC9_154549 [bioreactor metagenome]|uniref:Uncharacterized protein n=1 Tax=bioreactor metagenome TaxID=1076179 RepID=A0A645F3Z1_9ZZZZ
MLVGHLDDRLASDDAGRRNQQIEAVHGGRHELSESMHRVAVGQVGGERLDLLGSGLAALFRRDRQFVRVQIDEYQPGAVGRQ